ncbi:MAG: T9SS type A sorting domain-containing protein [Bacteroidetes bacterium]|nr:T9SS type A sorting domain-containing protein [Bacteroidota bacterium]
MMKVTTGCYFLLSVIIIFSFNCVFGQYPPPAGQPGTTAMYKDSSSFISWAKYCKVQRGYVKISDTTFLYNGTNKATYGDEYWGVGRANDSVVSLGDAGCATLSFDPPIINGDGFDFAVFENGLSDTFLELAFVEVSSDGVRYVRFPSVSLTQTNTQVGTFGTLDATKINNLAGKYRDLYGTPFNLDDIKDSSGINLNHITQMRIIDVVGCIQPPYATYDSQGHIVNDLWPTPFWNCGFDLDAVGVIHSGIAAIEDHHPDSFINIYPNPVKSQVKLSVKKPQMVSTIITDVIGRVIISRTELLNSVMLDFSFFPNGIYFAHFSFSDGTIESKKIIKQ